MISHLPALVRRRFRVIYLAPVLALVALLAWCFASPMGAAPDDDYHLASIWCGNPVTPDACPAGGAAGERSVPAALHGASCYAQQPEVSASCQNGLVYDSDATVVTNRGNFLGQYPPVYYAVMSLLAGPDILTSVMLMRLLNVVLFLGITTALAVLLPTGRRLALIGGWLIATVPLGAFLIASNNPSAWAIIGVGSAFMALHGYFETTGRRRVALGALFAVAALMASGARTDAAIYVVMAVAIAIWLTVRRSRGYLLTAILPVVVAVVAVIFYLQSGQSVAATSGLGGGGLPPESPIGSHAPRDTFGLIAYNLLQVPSLWVGAFGMWGLGWLDTSLPAVVWVAGSAVFAVAVFAGLRQSSWRKALAVAGVAFVLWVLPTYILVAGGNVVGENVQPRYLLPLIVLLAMVALLPAGRRAVDLSMLQLSVIGAGLIVANAFALHSNIRRYVTGVDEAGVNLDSGAEWWWAGAPSPMTTWIIGTLAYAGLLIVLGREVKTRGLLSHDRV